MPLNSGDRIYTAHLVGALARAGARIRFMGLDNPDDPTGQMSELDDTVDWQAVPGAPRSKIRSLSSMLPLVGARFATPAYRDALRAELRAGRYDAIVLDQYAMSWAVKEIESVGRKGAVLVHIGHNFETELTADIAQNYTGDPLRKLALRLNAIKTSKAEIELTLASDLVVTLTAYDGEAFRRIDPGHRTIVLSPGYSGRRRAERLISPTLPRRVVVVGSFQWIAKQMNLERFMNEAVPRLTEAGLAFEVVGAIPDDVRTRWRTLFPTVVFRGFVDDLAAVLDQARLALIIEEVGGGFKLKTLDYIFNRSPIAAIEKAMNGIPASVSDHFILAENGRELAAKVVAVIDQTDVLQSMQENAFLAATGLFDWNQNGQKLLAAIQNVKAS